MVLSDRTRALVGKHELALMKPTAMLVNTSRGPIVDEAALVEALRAGTIAGAGLDVFDTEPLPVDHPLRGIPGTVLTGHTMSCRKTMRSAIPKPSRTSRRGSPAIRFGC
jgi:phosphoglycerate dehydrogenase-like enzyme